MQHTNRQVILVVDDNITNLKVAIDYLQGHGLEIVIARSGETGVERASFVQPDLILLDVGLPGMDGFETCRRLKADPATTEIPVIFMTALADVKHKVKGFAVGGVDYITKPIQVEEVWARVHTHLTIRALQRSLEDKIDELNAFAHTVAHDLKSPLTRVIGGLDLLQELAGPVLDAEANTVLNIALQGGLKMVSIVDELLLLASVRQGEVATQPLDMAEIVDQACERLSPQMEQAAALVTFPASWPAAQGYAPWVEEVWANYLSNGLKYGGCPPRLELGAAAQADHTIRFWVRDNGPGLSLEDQSRLFTEFTRLHQVRAEGHGLGLSIVQRIVRKLGGTVGVESREGQGSVFYFCLPSV